MFKLGQFLFYKKACKLVLTSASRNTVVNKIFQKQNILQTLPKYCSW